jgi:hypothetical protein
LFDAILVNHLENPHSDFIAWLLDPRGPLTDAWLTQRLYDFVEPDAPWPGVPTVEREVRCDEGRADILVSWESGFKIVIENKVVSSEGKDQIRRYLTGFRIDNKSDGRVVYLTPSGRKSKSKGHGVDDLVIEMSYEQFAILVRRGLDVETSERGKVFAAEFLMCISTLLRRSNLMERIAKAGFSEASKLYMASFEAIEAIKEQAIEESAVFLQWFGAEATKRLTQLLGEQLRSEASPEGWIFLHMPGWMTQETRYGIFFGPNYNIKNRTLGDKATEHYAGVCVMGSEVGDWATKRITAPVSESLNRLLRKAWPHKADVDDPDYNTPLWRWFPIPANGDFDVWAEQILQFMEEIASKLGTVMSENQAEISAGL